MGDVDTDKDDRPLEPPRLISVEVLLNPFEDIVPRDLPGAGALGSGADASTDTTKKKAKKKGKKDLKLLSFGDEAEEEEKQLQERSNGKGVRSAHDALDDEKLSKDTAYDVSRSAGERGRAGRNDATGGEGLREAVKSAARTAAASKANERASAAAR